MRTLKRYALTYCHTSMTKYSSCCARLPNATVMHVPVVELMRVLDDVRDVQRNIGLEMPLLVDEKIHYSVSRLMYSKAYMEYDVHSWLRQVPLLYGVWHPYKQTLHLVYRTFFSVVGVLESTGDPTMGCNVRCQRKVVYMEKIFAALLLGGNALRDQVDSKLRQTVRGTKNQDTVAIVFFRDEITIPRNSKNILVTA